MNKAHAAPHHGKTTIQLTAPPHQKQSVLNRNVTTHSQIHTTRGTRVAISVTKAIFQIGARPTLEQLAADVRVTHYGSAQLHAQGLH